MSSIQTFERPESLELGVRPAPNPDAGLIASAAREAIEFYRRIRRDDDELPEAYRSGGEWKNYVRERSWFYDALIDGDEEAATSALREFWRNLLGPIVSQYAYFSDLEVGDEAKTERFVEQLTADYDHWGALWCEDPSVLTVPEVGNPWGLVLDGVLVTPLALRFHSHARQIRELLRAVETPIVAEIGGGYGGMGHRLLSSEPRVTYVDFDLPETVAIAAFYLKATMPDRKICLWDTQTPLDRDSLLRHDIVLAPHYAIAELGELSVDLLLNAFSLSEMPPVAIAEYMAALSRCGRRYFLQNNVDRKGVVNRGFERTPCSEFPIDRDMFKTVYFKFDTFQGPAGDYRESLHERLRPVFG